MVEICDIEGSKDSTLRVIRVADIEGLIKESNINHIYLNGRKAYNLFIKYYPAYKEHAHYLPSSSPANARYRLDDLLKAWSIIKDVFVNKKEYGVRNEYKKT